MTKSAFVPRRVPHSRWLTSRFLIYCEIRRWSLALIRRQRTDSVDKYALFYKFEGNKD